MPKTSDTYWVTKGNPDAVRVDGNLVLVAGRYITVLNDTGAEIWDALRSGPVRTEAGSRTQAFLKQLESLNLTRRMSERGAPQAAGRASETGNTEPVTWQDRSTAEPRIIRKGAVELMAYGSTGGPIEGKPMFGPPINKRDPDDKD
jgi:hypothetical protein